MTYDDKVRELYQAPLDQFVAERKRLAAELRAAGDRAAAERLTKAHRPTMSAWVVNQLYWHARDAFDAMLATAARLREGELAAQVEHRDAIGKLRERAAAMLVHAGHAASEPTLRRVTATLSAIAAAGGFDPDPPGALSADRDPPGFEAIGVVPAKRPHDGNGHGDGMSEVHAKAHAQKEAAAERKRLEAERTRLRQERHRLEAALRTARGDVHTGEREVATLDKQLDAAKTALADAHELVKTLEAQIAELGDGN